jgi:heme exporter protein A
VPETQTTGRLETPPTSASNSALPFWMSIGGVALAEGAVGGWLRRLPTGVEWDELAGWLGILLAILLGRVGFSWLRDRQVEDHALAEGERFVRRVWARQDTTPERGAWLAREGREIAEQGARARRTLQAATVSLIVLLPLLVWLSPLLSSALLAIIPAVGWASRKRWRAAKSWATTEQKVMADHATEEEWAWRSFPESRASGFGGVLGRLRRRSIRELTSWRRDGLRRLVDGQALTELAAHLAGWTLASLALVAWARGLLPAQDLLAFLAAALLLYRPIREAGRALPAFHRHRELALPPPKPAFSGTPPSRSIPLRVRELEVRSREGGILVRGPTFEIPPGGALLLSGANGSGKTSLLGGLAGWLPASGIESRPKRIRCLAQEPVLPPFSPRDWSGVRSPNELPLYPILFPDGLPCNWEDPIPAGGSRLSRGERARLALLCQTARSADLWLFDEPFSALPFVERSELLAALRGVQGPAALLLTDPLTLDPTGTERVWSPDTTQASPSKGPTILRLW